MYPLRLSQLRSILIRNLDTRISTNQSSCSVVDCFCELRDVTTNDIVHQTLLCKETLNPRWVLPQEEHRRLDLATVKEFSLHVVAVSPHSSSSSSSTTTTPLTPTQPPISTPPILSTTVNVLELVPLNIDYATLQSFDGLPLNTVLFEACGGAFYAHPDLVQTLTGKISMSRVPALTELKEQILTSTSASSILEKAFAYQRATDDFERQAQEAREDVVFMSRKEANDKIVKEELELITRSIQIKKKEEMLARENLKIMWWERKIGVYEGVVEARAQHVQTIASQLQNKNKKTGRGEGGGGGGDADSGDLHNVQKAQVLHLESTLVRLEFILRARQLKLMYELTTIYPIERIQLEASGHATAYRNQRGTSGSSSSKNDSNKSGHKSGGGGGQNSVRRHRTSAFEDDLVDKVQSKNEGDLNLLIPHRLAPEIVQSRSLSKTAKKKKRDTNSSSNQVMSIRGLVLPQFGDITTSEEEKVS